MNMSLKSALVAAGLLTLHGSVFANEGMISLPDKPIYVGGGVQPMVMLDVTKDHQLHMKAYNDYTDLDNDGVAERTYKHSIDYYGYFDTKQCYSYNTSTQRYEPSSVATNKYCNGTWSGNFLNWATMTRMDIVRKILYGGYRSTDTATSTVLERNFLPTDAHSFAKYYGGDDLGKLTPFSKIVQDPFTVNTVDANGSTANFNLTQAVSGSYQQRVIYLSGDQRSKFVVGDQVLIAQSLGSNNNIRGTVTAIAYGRAANNRPYRTQLTIRLYQSGISGSASSVSSVNITNLTRVEGGISICNTTPATRTSTNKSQTLDKNTFPPLIRVSRGNFELWGANSSIQCQWSESSNNTGSGFGIVGSNGNNVGLSEMSASAENPQKSSDGLGTGYDVGEYVARVEVCKSATIVAGTDEFDLGKCKLYGSSWKPVGLLQKYSDTDLIRFGLMTGSYQKNKSGGVLRKNIGKLDDEVNVLNGTFKASSAAGSIIHTLNNMRIYGYNYGAGDYLGSAGDNCTYQLTSITEGSCRSYGNPMSEIYQESIRYLAGKTPTATYNYGTGSADATLGLPAPSWISPLNKDNFCAPLNVIVFNSSVSGEDSDLANQSLSDFTYPTINKSIKSATDKVGELEGLNGKMATFGASSATVVSSNEYALCSAKQITSLGDIFGICPEGPSTNGSYHMAGIASVIKNTRITNFSTVPNSDVNSLKVNSYAVQLASNTPEIEIPVNGKIVKLSPIYRLDKSSAGTGPFGSGAIVDFKIGRISNDGSSGLLYINWEDSQQGGDYDQDLIGTISWEITSAGKLKITTQTVAASGNSGQGFGYSLSGTDNDGPHFHSGIYNYDFTDPKNIEVFSDVTNQKLNSSSGKINSSGGCRNCTVDDPATYALYNVTGVVTENLKDPLYYLAKYGGFKDRNGNGIPDLTVEWDAFNNITGAVGSDGIPDNYFYAINPLQLESSLQQAFNSILVTSSSSSVAANSTFLRNNTLVYQAKYFTGDWSGQFVAYNLGNDGRVLSTAWEADLLLNNISADNRKVVTYNSNSKKGVPYRWTTASNSGLSQKIIDALNKNAAGTVDGNGQRRLNWARGSSSDESSLFRPRLRSKLGDIIESSPVYVGVPESYVNDPTFKVYQNNKKNRKPLVYVGANDGMLHAFDALTGAIHFSYMPGVVAEGNLISKASSINYGDTVAHTYGVNGSPTVADVKFGQSCSLLTDTCDTDTGWKTVLVGGLAHGGKGIYALDVTDPTTLTEGNAANIVLWEFTSASDNGLGYTFSQPQISRICNTRVGAFKPQMCTNSTPVAVFGGGINPASGKAKLFILNLGTGAVIKTLEVAGGTNTTPNALATPAIVDVDGDGVMEYVYAGDLNGKMWKFDVQSASGAKVDFSGEPLYHAKMPVGSGFVNQPITSAPEIVNHPWGGYLVLFGTGKYIEGNDLGTTGTQSFYSIWDKNLAVQTMSNRSNLQAQVNDTREISVDGDYDDFVYRKSSSNSVDWSLKNGWYMDMGNSTSSDPGERIIYSPQIYNNGIVSFSSLVPAGGVCTFGGYSWNYFLDAVTGAALKSNPFGNDEQGLSSRKSTNGIVTPSTLIYVGNGISYAPQSGTSGNLEISKLNLSGGRTGRVSWREIR